MNSFTRTARATGAWYLALALSGMLGFVLIRPQLYVAGDTQETLARLSDNAQLAHASVVLEMVVVLTQALTALFFYKLIAGFHRVAAVGVMAFGLMNAAAIMVSAIFMATAVAVSGESSLAPGGDAAATVGLLSELSTNSWSVGNLFFGLWLIPMGWFVLKSALMPRLLGWFLIIGGAGYLLAAVIEASVEAAPALLINGLPLGATVGEVWMIGYLLFKGIRTAPAAIPEPALVAEASR